MGRRDDTDSLTPSGFGAAGGLTSTATDLAVWGEAFGSGALLSEAAHAAQLGDPIVLQRGAVWYGLGTIMVGEGREDPELELGHNGALNGAAGWMGHRPARGATLVVLGNSWPRTGRTYDYEYPMEVASVLWERIEAAD